MSRLVAGLGALVGLGVGGTRRMVGMVNGRNGAVRRYARFVKNQKNAMSPFRAQPNPCMAAITSSSERPGFRYYQEYCRTYGLRKSMPDIYLSLKLSALSLGTIAGLIADSQDVFELFPDEKVSKGGIRCIELAGVTLLTGQTICFRFLSFGARQGPSHP